MARCVVEKNPPKEKLAAMGVSRWPIWEKGVSQFDYQYDEKETCFILEGEVTIEFTLNGKTEKVSFTKGDLVTFESGLSCVWKITKKVKKHYNFG